VSEFNNYPPHFVAELTTVNGSACGTPHHVCDIDETVNPPEYNEVPAQGHFDYVWMRRVTLTGGTVTWRMKIKYDVTGPCRGTHDFQRVPNADDPIGYFHKIAQGQPDQTKGTARTYVP
jgi:hypothetical protein